MARSVSQVRTFTHDPKYRLSKEMLVVRCDDGCVYEFEKPKDHPSWSMNHAIQPDGHMTHTDASNVLPAAVEETVSDLIEGWS